MQVIDSIKNIYSSVYGSITELMKPSHGVGSSVGIFGSSPSFTVGPFNKKKALSNPIVNICTMVIAQNIAQLPFYSEDNADVTKLFRRPNPWQYGIGFKSHLLNDLLNEGNAYVRTIRGEKTGKLKYFVPLNADRTYIESIDGMPVYREKPNHGVTANPETDKAYSYDEIIHIRDFLGPGIIGRSRVHAAWTAVNALNYANSRMQHTFEKGLLVSFVGKAELGTDDKKLAQQVAAFNARFDPAEGDEAGGVAVLEGVELTPVKALSPAEGSLLELRQDLAREIAAMFGVPPFLAGGTGDTKYSNTSSRTVSMYRNCFEPIINLIVEAFSVSCDCEVSCNDKKLLSGDIASQIDMLVKAVKGGIYTANEAREEVNKDEHEDGNILYSPGTEANEDRGDRTGEFPTDDGNIGDGEEDADDD